MIVTTGGITAFHAAAGVSAPEIAPWKSKICTSTHIQSLLPVNWSDPRHINMRQIRPSAYH